MFTIQVKNIFYKSLLKIDTVNVTNNMIPIVFHLTLFAEFGFSVLLLSGSSVIAIIIPDDVVMYAGVCDCCACCDSCDSCVPCVIGEGDDEGDGDVCADDVVSLIVTEGEILTLAGSI